MLPALAHSLCVDIIVFNTSRRSVPFYPVSSTVWGGEKTTKPPLLLIYDEAHYETALPATALDSQLTIDVLSKNSEKRLRSPEEQSKVRVSKRKKNVFINLGDSVGVEGAEDVQVNKKKEWTRVERRGKEKTNLKKVETKESDLMTKKRKIFEQLEDIKIEFSRNEEAADLGSCDKDEKLGKIKTRQQ